MALAAVSAGCAEAGEEATGTTASPPATAPVGGPPEPGIDAPGEVVVPWWIRGTVVGNGAARAVPPDVDRVRFALDAVLAGPNEGEQAAGLRTLIQADTFVYDLEVVDGLATVSLSRAFQTENSRPQTAQVVYTLTQFEEVDAVAFLIDGTPNGSVGTRPFSRYRLALPPERIRILEETQGP